MRVCATCKHHRAMTAPQDWHCVGCIKDGECRRWEEMDGENAEGEGQAL